MTLEVKRYRLRHRLRPLDVLVAGEGPPLVLLHGWGLRADAYEDAMIALAERGYRVAAPTVSVHEDWSIEAVTDLTAEAMAGVDAAPAPVIGHSFGGVIGAQLAYHHTDFLRALIAVSSPLVSLGNLRLGRIVLPGRHYRIAAHRHAAGALVRTAISPKGVTSLLRSARWFLGSGHDAPLPEIAKRGLPRAVVWTERDAVLPRSVGERSAELLGCDFTLITGEDEAWPGQRPPDHDWPLHHPDHFADTMARLLRTSVIPRPLPGEPSVDGEASKA